MFKYLKNRCERIMRKLWPSLSRWRAEENETYFVLTFFSLRNSVTSLLPTRDKATFDGLSKDTPEICGKAGNSTQPEVHSWHHPNSRKLLAKRWLERVFWNIFHIETVPSVFPPDRMCQGFSSPSLPCWTGCQIYWAYGGSGEGSRWYHLALVWN